MNNKKIIIGLLAILCFMAGIIVLWRKLKAPTAPDNIVTPKQAIQINTTGDQLITGSQHYKIYYLVKSRSYFIQVLASPFEKYRQEGELALLTRLEVTKTEACNLPVQIGTTNVENKDEFGKLFTLSFCPTF